MSKRAADRARTVHEVRARMTETGEAAAAACRALGVSPASFARWAEKVDAGEPGDRSRAGRPAMVQIDEETGRALREFYVRSNLGKGRRSMTTAARMFARRPECPPEVAEAILKPRSSKHALPSCIRDAMRLTRATVRRSESGKAYRLEELPNVPGTMRTSADGSRRLHAGELQSWDDATVNFVFVVPWPHGGDPCSEKFGVRLGRFQLLANVDHASSYCPGFHLVVRSRESYRGEDVAGAMFADWTREGCPAGVIVEGGVWQSKLAVSFYEAAGVPWHSAKGRPQQKLVENWFGKLWTPLACLPGNVGRYRGQQEEQTKLYLAARDGRVDPRDHFLVIDEAANEIEQAIRFLNSEPMESKIYGRWVPEERYRADLEARPLRKLDPAVSWAALPERHFRAVRPGGVLQLQLPTPLGVSLPYVFAGPDLLAHVGRKVWLHFCRSDKQAVISDGRKKLGTCRLISDIPTLERGLSGWRVSVERRTAEAGAVRVRKDSAQHVQKEYRGLGLKSDKQRLSEMRRDKTRILIESGGAAQGAVQEDEDRENAPERLPRAERDAGPVIDRASAEDVRAARRAKARAWESKNLI